MPIWLNWRRCCRLRRAAAPRMWLLPAKRALRYGVEASKLMAVDDVRQVRKRPASGATRFCNGRGLARTQRPRHRGRLGVDPAVKSEAPEARCTLGMLDDGYAEILRDAGLDYYNHNLDTAPDFYNDIISTRDYQDCLDDPGAGAQRRHQRVLRGIVGMVIEFAARRTDCRVANLAPKP